MKYLSVCSGIEAATVAWHELGFEPVAFSEIETFPSQVLAHHYPKVPNWGDMTKFKEWPDANIDLLVGGTPCQSFSVAGLRGGLDDPRGNLMLTYLSIADRYRPKWIVWENVPGVLSSNRGRDFGTFLGALGQLGYGWSYRVLDAQYFGVAQRRRRVFVVGYLGDWRPATAVLLERESLLGNPPPSRKKKQEAARSIGNGVEVRSHDEISVEVNSNLESVGENANRDFVGADEAHPIAYAFDAISSNNMKSKNPISGCNEVDVSKTLDTTRGLDPSCNQGGIGIVQTGTWWDGSDLASTLTKSNANGAQRMPDKDNFGAVLQAIPIHDQATRHSGRNGEKTAGKGNGLGIGEPSDPCPTLTNVDMTSTLGAKNPMAVAIQTYDMKQHHNPQPSDTAQLTTKNCSNVRGDTPLAHHSMAVRRLSPVECERLQGFPDGYTDIRPKGKNTSDTSRYKALGNSMAVPVMRWIGKRIVKVEKVMEKLKSK